MEIKIRNVTKKIKDAIVLDCINMELKSGTVYGLQGKNGSGKTMLLRLLCGFILPSEGEVEINGKVLGKELSFPENTGVLIENPAFLDYFTGYDNLKILAEIRNKMTEKEIEEILEKVGLDPNDKRKYRKYSLGMKQRLGIACAFMEKPDLILLDEPTNALDPEGIECLHRRVEEAKERKALIILACHDAEELNQMADVVIQMDRGRVMGG